MSQRILVTGGLGFIGSHLLQRLLKSRAGRVVIVDDLSGTAMPAGEILHEISSGNFSHLEVHLEAIADYAERIQNDEAETAFDTIYHLASIVGPAAVLSRAGWITESIVRDASAVVRLAQRSSARLVNVSTSEVYGGGLAGYCREDTPRMFRGAATARQEYAAGKLAAEIAIENLSAAGKLDAITVRPFNVAGIRQSGRGGFVLPRFIAQAILHEPLTVFGDGRQVRAFTDARDIAAALVLAAEAGASGAVYNVGNPHNRVSIGELADCVLEVTGSPAGACHVDPRLIYGPAYAEAADKFPDASRITGLGWQPQFDLVTTVQDTYEYMRRLSPPKLLALSGLAGPKEPSLLGAVAHRTCNAQVEASL